MLIITYKGDVSTEQVKPQPGNVFRHNWGDGCGHTGLAIETYGCQTANDWPCKPDHVKYINLETGKLEWFEWPLDKGDTITHYDANLVLSEKEPSDED